jgi:DDE superfamily endonuclease
MERKPRCQDRFLLFVLSPKHSCKRLSLRSVAERRRSRPSSAFVSCCSFMSILPCLTTRRPPWWTCRRGKCNAGEVVGQPAISPSKIVRGVAERPLFPPLDQALVQAMACEVVAETKLPLSRQSVADLVGRAQSTLGKEIGRTTVWRMLHEAAIKPWQYAHWIFPRDPQFAEKAGPILDLYAGIWEGKPLGPKDYALSMDEKTSIQARGRKHDEMPPETNQTRRIETEYDRNGALQYLAAWDVHRGIVLGRCAAKTGIQPFGHLVDQVLSQAPYDEAERLFFIVDNGSSHRGKASVERMRRRDKRIILVHTPVHASWLNQVEIYFSIIQRKVLTPNDFATLNAVRVRLALYEELSNRTPKPFKWKFTRQDLLDWLKRASPHILAASAA